jgi:integrase
MTTSLISIDTSPRFRRRGTLSDQQKLIDFLPDYLEGHVSKLSKPTRSKYEFHIRKHIRPDLGSYTLAEITPRVLDVWLARKKQAGLSWAYRADLRGIVSGVFTTAKRWGVYTGENPAKLISLGRKRPVREQRKLSIRETRAILAELPDDVRRIVHVALFCTLRISEILGLKWKHIDLERGIVKVRERFYRGDLDQTKTEGSSRDVPLGDLVEEFRQLAGERIVAPEEYVFEVRTARGSTRDDRTINRAFLRPTAQKLGIYWQGFGFHAFRREAITGIAAEADPIQAMRAAGHTRMDTTLLYGLQDFERQDKAIRRMQSVILQRRGAA